MPNLVGTGLNQLPTNSMLGGMAYQSPDHTSIKDLDLKNLSQINSEIAGTAVDVFVYDTSKDSDGGAWRKRTQRTSWYNETLNTSTRGSRREFPAVAVIVCTNTQVRIYDGDDPDLPLWMEFVTGGNWSHILVSTSGYIKAAEMLNGELVIARNLNTGWQLVKVSFISDTAYAYKNVAHGTGDGQWNGGIVSRNGNGGYTTISTASNIISQYNNDVAMTVLPNAPIDSATGLPVPTIAVGTAGLLSVIRDDGTVVYYSGFAPTEKVAIDNSYVYASTRSGANDYIFKSSFLSADGSHSANIIAGSGGFVSGSTSSWIPQMKNMTITDMTIKDDHTVIRSGTDGIEIFDGNVNTLSNTLATIPVAYITSTYNTGYMVGNIKGAFLSDTDDTDVAGGELVTNGTFNSNTTGWSNYTSTISIDSQRLKVIPRISGTNGYATQSVSTIQGKRYILTLNVTGGSGNNNVFLGTSESSTNIFEAGWTGVTRSITKEFIATGTYTWITLATDPTTSSYTFFDNVSLIRVEKDRSVNNNGLQVFGTITKSPVATGADLVGYGPFSTSNYLLQPYNDELAPGTGAYSVICWFKTGTSTADQYIFDRTGDNAPRNLILIRASNQASPNRIQFYHNNASNTNSDLIATDLTVTDNIWHQIVALCDGSTYRVYIDGVASAITNSTIRNIDNTDNPTLYVGIRNSLTAPLTGQMALFRYSKTAPSAEQIKKIYEDERVLFQEGAQCTLYGSSDAVTALAYDETTSLLHVGTSSGRSDFSGLKRINNTTTAVTTAISAYDGFITEQ